MPPVLPTERIAPRYGRLLHPSSWAERDERDLAADIFSKEVAQKQATLLPRQQRPSSPEIVSEQVSGGEARMNFHFSHALPTGGPSAPRQDRWQWFLSPKLARDALHRASPNPADLATFKIPTPFASCFRTFRSVALSIFGRPSFTPCATAALEPCFDALADHRPLAASSS